MRAAGISLDMLPCRTHGEDGPTIVMLHWLGGSSKTWIEASEALAQRGLRCIAVDLPGFGRAADCENFSVAGSVDSILATIQQVRGRSTDPWLLAGHSMGGKFAAILARAALNGVAGLQNLSGIVLISPSPPGPEPMKESVRQQMMDSLGKSTRDGEKDREHARQFVRDNVGKHTLGEAIETRAVDDVLRMNRAALMAWLVTGSKEDWAERVGVIAIPALILAGTEEAALGPRAQQEHTMPQFPNATLVPLEGAGHLAPIERPAEVADRIAAFVVSLGIELPVGFSIAGARVDVQPSADLMGLIESDRTSAHTREVLKRRLAEGAVAATDAVLSEDELLTLRSVVARVVPGCLFDLAERVHAWLALPQHDGWRHDALPPDLEAWKLGLHSLNAAPLREHGTPFVALNDSEQDKLLRDARDGKLGRGVVEFLHAGAGNRVFSATEMRDWFGDVCAQVTRTYIADPRTMARIGFSGFADEGGFTRIRLNEREDFELNS